ncbi:MAG: hypothetical protein SF187_04900 [Deltaproteobacteria bacterium]|nr:hypothetical protein [Deltaproteobacteria bacterium]
MRSLPVFLCLCVAAAFGLGRHARAESAFAGPSLPALVSKTFHPASYVRSLAQTTDGYVWMGTQRGLFRFDGMRFVLFASDQTPGMPTGEVTALWATRTRSLWVGTEHGLALFENGRFTKPAGIPTHIEAVRRFTMDANGWLWMATSSGLLQTRGDVWVHHGVAEGLPTTDVTDVVIDPEGGLWVQTSQGRAKRQGDRFVSVSPSLQVGATALPLPLFVSRAVRDNIAAWQSFAGTNVAAALVDSQDALWIARPFAGGLLRWMAGQRQVFTMRDGLAANVLTSLLEDANGGVWAGTAGGGASLVQAARWREINRSDGLPGDAVFALAPAKQGGVWAALSGGVARVAQKRVQVWPVGKGLPQSSPRWVAEDKTGAVYSVDVEGHVAVMSDPAAERAAFAALPNVHLSAATSALFADESGRVWLALLDGRVDELNSEGAITVRPSDVACAGAIPLCPSAVRSFAQRSAGGLWLGTFAQGVWRMNAQGQLQQEISSEQITDEPVLSLIEDDAGVLWIGNARGLVRFDGKRARRFTAADGLAASAVTALVQDGAGRVWGAGPGGFFCVHEAGAPAAGSTTFVNFGVEDGLANETFAAFGMGATRSRDGRLWFASQAGLVAVEAPEDVSPPRIPPVLIESVQGEGIEARVVLAEDERIEVPRNDVRILFTAPAFNEAQRVRLRYRVGRNPQGWVDVGPHRFAHLVALPPGNILFEVQASRIDRPGEVQSARIRLIVSRRYYERPIFVVVILLILGAFALALRAKVKRRAQLSAKDLR